MESIWKIIDLLTVLPLNKCLFYIICFNVVVFHLEKLLFLFIAILLFLSGFFFRISKSEEVDYSLKRFLNSKRTKDDDVTFFKLDANIEDSFIENDTKSTASNIQFINTFKPQLTGSYLIDDELHKIIDLVIRDYIDSWYKEISSKEDFSKRFKQIIYETLRHINLCLKQVDWEHFLLNIVAHNLVVQMRLLKKAKEKIIDKKKRETNTSLAYAATKNQSYLNESLLVDVFFDLEAEIENDICRDQISFESNDKEQEFLEELSEIVCYSLLRSNTFNCIPLRCLIREIFSRHLISHSIDRLTDPDYINQTVIYLLNEQPILTEDFLVVLNHSDNIDELNEIKSKIDEEIQRTRSNDKGGQNDQEIKQQLSSLQFVRRRIDLNITNLSSRISKLKSKRAANTNQKNMHLIQNKDELNQIKNILSQLDFSNIINNQLFQHCFIEYMSKENVQNLISFYLNANMYKQFAIKELRRSQNEINETKVALKDFAKGLINSYLLSAANFTATGGDLNDEPVMIANHQYYKAELTQTVEKLENPNYLNENLLDDLQKKIYNLMESKYYPKFKRYPEFYKLLIKNKFYLLNLASENKPLDDALDSQEDDTVILINKPQTPAETASKTISNVNHFKLQAVITSSGRCNDLKSTYAIYIIDVTKMYEDTTAKNEYWQTYRRFNDFYDLHLYIKKKCPNLKNLILPGKSFRNSLSEEFLERRRVELNKYLQTLCNQFTLLNNPNLLELMLKFLENKRWDNTQTNFDRRVDSLFLSTVKNIQSSIKNAPDNVIGMVKGLSDNLISNSVVDTFSKINPTAPLSSTESPNDLQVVKNPKTLNKNELDLLDVTPLNNDDSNNLPVRVVLVLIDEIFDLKEKNQWIRQSLMAIVKSIMRNFKSDSMNRKIKEQIADYLNEEHLARYLKNFRKRLWPKGLLADPGTERSNGIKYMTRILAKTKFLQSVPDDLRHILGNNTSRRGVFDFFDLFQHKSINKRLLYILLESLLNNFFQLNLNSATQLPKQIDASFYSSNLQVTPLSKLIRVHLCKSARIKHEKSKNKQISTSPSISLISSSEVTEHGPPRSKSLYGEINC